MDRLKSIWRAHRALLSYLFFGGLTTLVNIVTYWCLARAGLSTGVANGLALAVSIAFAYATNRRWVFESRTRGLAMFREIGWFVACRLGTGLMDQVIMVAGVDYLGPMIVPEAALSWWGLGVKVFSNVLVIVANFVFSKVLIFRKGKA
ncbi:MAG: GtrA family protein [Christensenellales bacterium]|nr:GtrA family protein [Christensenellales bacterium]